jgi:hypothetical protein
VKLLHPVGTGTSGHLDRGLGADSRVERLDSDRTQEHIELVPRSLDRLGVQYRLLSVPERPGAGSIKKPHLRVGPNGLNDFRGGLPDACAAAYCLPVTQAVDVQLGECLVDGADEFVHLLECVAGSYCNPETFGAHCNGGIIDGLNVDVVIGEQLVGCGFGEGGVADEDGNDVRGTGAVC